MQNAGVGCRCAPDSGATATARTDAVKKKPEKNPKKKLKNKKKSIPFAVENEETS